MLGEEQLLVLFLDVLIDSCQCALLVFEHLDDPPVLTAHLLHCGCFTRHQVLVRAAVGQIIHDDRSALVGVLLG